MIKSCNALAQVSTSCLSSFVAHLSQTAYRVNGLSFFDILMQCSCIDTLRCSFHNLYRIPDRNSSETVIGIFAMSQNAKVVCDGWQMKSSETVEYFLFMFGFFRSADNLFAGRFTAIAVSTRITFSRLRLARNLFYLLNSASANSYHCSWKTAAKDFTQVGFINTTFLL